MAKNIGRRTFLKGTLAASAAIGVASALQADQVEEGREQEFYELRIYHCTGEKQRETTSDYVRNALLPALGRQGLKRIGVFTVVEEKAGNNDLYMLIPYPELSALGEMNAKLAADEAYQKASASYFAIPRKEAPYARIESRLMKAFAGMPVMELPAESKEGKPRLFELRIYESYNEERARAKVAMFNDGEIDIMRKVELDPVMFGETLISNDVPNLTYLLSAADAEDHKKHWDAFRVHPDWDRMKKMEKYRDTVSKITSITLVPTSYSRI